jgi:hypothetical protein
MRTAYPFPMSDSEQRRHAQLAKLTQLLLMGDSWREVRRHEPAATRVDVAAQLGCRQGA